MSLPTCFVNKNEPSINQASHLPKGYYLQVNTHRSVSFNGSRNAFLLPSNGESDSPFALMFEVDKIRMPVEEAKRNTNVPWLSTVFILMVICRAFSVSTPRFLMSLLNVATITHLKEKRASLGSYAMWGHIGASIFLFAVGQLASHFTLNICGVIGVGYYLTFVWSSAAIMFSSFAVPWFKYEYLKHRVISWTDVKCVFSDIHYVFMLVVGLFLGSCCAFQVFW